MIKSKYNCKLVFICISIFLLINIRSGLSLYFDFEDNAQLKDWDLQGTWKIVKDDTKGSNVLSGEGANEVCALVGDINWTDYTLEFEASGQTDEISAAFRAKDPDNYIGFMIAPSLNLTEFFQKLNGQFNENISAKGDSLGVKIQQWNKYKLIVQGNKAIAYLNGKETIKELDLDKLPKDFEKGRVGFRQWSDKAYYDNFLITGPGIPRTPGEPGLSVDLKRILTITWASIKRNSNI